jgi:hypothetical protein
MSIISGLGHGDYLLRAVSPGSVYGIRRTDVVALDVDEKYLSGAVKSEDLVPMSKTIPSSTLIFLTDEGTHDSKAYGMVEHHSDPRREISQFLVDQNPFTAAMYA